MESGKTTFTATCGCISTLKPAKTSFAKLSNMKISIIQSDYDLLCPPQTSFNFASGLSNCKIIRIASAGHYISDPGVKEMMKELLDEYEKI